MQDAIETDLIWPVCNILYDNYQLSTIWFQLQDSNSYLHVVTFQPPSTKACSVCRRKVLHHGKLPFPHRIFSKKTTDATWHIFDVFRNQLVYHMAISCLSFFWSKEKSKTINFLYALFLLIPILIFAYMFLMA